MKSQERAVPDVQELAELCLGFLAENPDELANFLTQTGYSPQALRAAIGSRQLQAGLIDYFAANESILLAVCANNGLKPEAFMRTWAKLNPAG